MHIIAISIYVIGLAFQLFIPGAYGINLLYLPTLGGAIYHVLVCGIKATWWNKLRSMLFLLDTLISIKTMHFLENELYKFYFNCRYADIYTSRVSNFLYYTPFMSFRSQEQVCESSSFPYFIFQIHKSLAYYLGCEFSFIFCRTLHMIHTQTVVDKLLPLNGKLDEISVLDLKQICHFDLV